MGGKLREELGFGDPIHDAKWNALRALVAQSISSMINLSVPLSLRVHEKQISSIATQICAALPTLFTSPHLDVTTIQTRRAMLEHYIVSLGNDIRQRRLAASNTNPNPNANANALRPAPYPAVKAGPVQQNQGTVGPIRRLQAAQSVPARVPVVNGVNNANHPPAVIAQTMKAVAPVLGPQIKKSIAPVHGPVDFASPLSHTLTYPPTPRPQTPQTAQTTQNFLFVSPSTASTARSPPPNSEPSDIEGSSNRLATPVPQPVEEASGGVQEEEDAEDNHASLTPEPEPVASPECEPQHIKVESDLEEDSDEIYQFLASRHPPLLHLHPYLVEYGCTDMVRMKVMSGWPNDEIHAVVAKMMAVKCEGASPTKPMDWDMFRHFLRELKAL